MINVYVDPFSSAYLHNKLFSHDKKLNRGDYLSVWSFLREYCLERNINLNTIDFWDENKATDEDIYVSLEHKPYVFLSPKERIFFGKIYSILLNKNYRIPKIEKFKKKILFQHEPPVVSPHVYKNIDRVLKIYDKVFFSCIIDNPKCHYFHLRQIYNNIIPEYYKNPDRKFLVMINSNKKPRSRDNELYSERIKVTAFFSKTDDIDLYGSGWNKPPFFPLRSYKGALQKVYRGYAESKYQTLSEYDFAIAFENTVMPGHVCEKIFDCFFVGTIPVYLGAPDIEKYVPKECFIDMRDFRDYGKLKRFLKSLTKSEIELYRENARKYLNSEQYKPFTKEHFAEVFVDAIRK